MLEGHCLEWLLGQLTPAALAVEFSGGKVSDGIHKWTRKAIELVRPGYENNFRAALASAFTHAINTLAGQQDLDDAKGRFWRRLVTDVTGLFPDDGVLLSEEDAQFLHDIEDAMLFGDPENLQNTLLPLVENRYAGLPAELRKDLGDVGADAETLTAKLAPAFLRAFAHTLTEEEYSAAWQEFLRKTLQWTLQEITLLGEDQANALEGIKAEITALINRPLPDIAAVLLQQADTWKNHQEDTAILTAALLEDTILGAHEKTRGVMLEGFDTLRRELVPPTPALPVPNTLFAVPYGRNPNFSGRVEFLDRLHTALHADSSVGVTQAISGLGGVGKTQTALEYAYRHRQDYAYILWAEAATPDTLDRDYRALSHRLQLPLKDATETEVIREEVKRFLAEEAGSEQNKPWLLILDNVDDPIVVQPFLPINHSGHILFTSRDSDLRKLGARASLPLDIMTEGEALEFFGKATDLDLEDADERNAAAELAFELEYLPLALEQATAYIDAPEIKGTFADYLADYWKRKLELLEKYTSLQGSYARTVAATWEINFEQIANEPVAELLTLCAFLAPERIPAEIFTRGAARLNTPLGNSLQAALESPHGFKELLLPATRYALIRYMEGKNLPSSDNKTLSLHRLVREVLLARTPQEQHRYFAENVLTAVAYAHPGGDFETWSRCELLLPHQRQCIIYNQNLHFNTTFVGTLYNQAAYYLDARGQYTEAEPLFLKALAIYRTAFGEEHPHVATSLNNLASLYRSQGRLTEAEPLYLQALAIRQNVLTEGHPDIALSLNNLAGLYQSQGRVTEAEPLFLQALAISQQALPDNHPTLALRLNNLAGLYQSQGRVTEAEPLYLQALKIRQTGLPEGHPDIAQSLNNLAELYRSQGRLTDVEPLYLQALEILVKALGLDHPNTRTVASNLASFLAERGKRTEARAIISKYDLWKRFG